MTAAVAVLATALTLFAAGPHGAVQDGALPLSATTTAAAQYSPQKEEPASTGTSDRGQDRNGKDGGVPIWAGIGLILLAAVAGSAAARARNRRRMRDLERRQRD